MTGAFLTLAVAVLVYFIADAMTLPVTPRYVAGPLGGDDFAVGVVIGSFSATALVLRPWAGRMSDRRGRRPLILAGAALFAVGMLGHLVATTIPVLILMRLVLGSGEAFLFVGALSAASDLAPEERRGEAISLISLSLYLGVAIGPFIGEAILGDGRYAAVWVAAAAIAGLAVLLALRMPETVSAAQRQQAIEDAGTPAQRGLRGVVHPAAILPGLVLLTSTAGMGGYFSFTTHYAINDLGLDVVWPAFALFAAIVIGFRSLMPWMPDRLGHRTAAYTALVFDTIGLATIALWAAPPGLFVGTAIFAFGVCFAFPALSAMVTGSVPRAERGAALGTFSAFLDLAFGVGPVALGLVATIAGYGPMYAVAAAIAAAGLVLLRLTRPRAAMVTGTADA
jgi:MFS family permease